MSSILHLTDQRRYYLYRKETDMRKGFDSLCGIIKGELGKQAMSGDAFIFINRPRTHIKLLVWEMDGFTIVYRRLEKGTFEVPSFNLDQDALSITSDQLHCILKGIKLSSVKYRKRYQHKSTHC
ncbi:MAG: IS66 family insertion sequence element accessory protein TnpB [Flavisolibacter sp.]|nr:IS66 family insertion sequence element accessory protein TnpB [Flavisolibacter sp.]